ncbi:TetR/AcrR family transcriptional regulator [Mycobacterium sp. 1274756.6]|uniref:TetR/AcrR family transcriptional regulator n=1 Tax=Mycobacterium sp. 1274756.6 TaxID=1834076 RepID=UPI0007FCAF89|nr:TetR/AcrR family transcriptional regulator [Mycobacterium sp. 1274756.6]OBJ68009.1 TetR family transcriptional regulator [Mycobacterium sp. 1274756.6]
MTQETGPRATEQDLTSKARIRNAALDLFARDGEDATSMRAIAAAAEVNVGLLVHHFKTKEGIREAVDQLVVAHFEHAIAGAEHDGTPRGIAAARNAAVSQMLARNPAVVDYLRRAVLSGPRSSILIRITDLATAEVDSLRHGQLASTDRSQTTQILGLMMRQLGQLFLQPMLDAMWEHLAGLDERAAKPTLSVTVLDPTQVDNPEYPLLGRS